MSTVTLVTGSSSGIGKELCFSLARKNPTIKVYASCRQPELVEKQVRASLQPDQAELLKRIQFIGLDVSDEKSIQQAIKTIIDKEGKIDVLVNNAGISCFMAGAVVKQDLAQKVFDVNFFGVVRVIQQVFPFMVQQKQGKIINVGSVAGRLASPFLGFYSASKAALALYTDSLRIECSPFHIQVLLVTPGMVESNIGDTCKNNAYYVPEDSIYAPYKASYMKTVETEFEKNCMKTRVFTDRLAGVVVRKNLPKVWIDGGMSYPAYFLSLLPKSIQDFIIKKTYKFY